MRNSYSELISFCSDLKDLLDFHQARALNSEGITIGDDGFEQDITWDKFKSLIQLHCEDVQNG